MLKKIREGEKGFTLVELLAVIVILGIIVAIAIPAIGSVIDRAGDDADDATETMIVDAARLYEMQEYSGEDESFSVTVGTLVEEKYLDERQGNLDSLRDKKVTKDEDGNFLYDGRVPGEQPENEG